MGVLLWALEHPVHTTGGSLVRHKRLQLMRVDCRGHMGSRGEQLRMQSIKMHCMPGRKYGGCAGSPETRRVQKTTMHSWEGEFVISALLCIGGNRGSQT